MSLPLVSVIIPAWNCETWLEACVGSVQAQDWPALELVLVNDGSTDKTGALADKLASGDARIRVLHTENRGAAAARNLGLAQSRGSWIQFLDGDDLLAPGKLSAQLALVQTAEPPPALISARWYRFEEDPAKAVRHEEETWRDLGGLEFLQLHFETGAMMHPAAWLSRRDLLEAAGPWNEGLSLDDDGEYFARVMLRAGTIRHCPAALSYYRSQLGGSLSKRRSRRALESLVEATASITAQMLKTSSDARTRAAAAHAWKWAAFEVYPECPDLTRRCEQASRELGGSRRPFPAGRRFQLLSTFVGWKLAKRLRNGRMGL